MQPTKDQDDQGSRLVLDCNITVDEMLIWSAASDPMGNLVFAGIFDERSPKRTFHAAIARFNGAGKPTWDPPRQQVKGNVAYSLAVAPRGSFLLTNEYRHGHSHEHTDPHHSGGPLYPLPTPHTHYHTHQGTDHVIYCDHYGKVRLCKPIQPLKYEGPQWTKTLADTQGHLYIATSLSNPKTIGPFALTPKWKHSIFVVKLNEQGCPEWASGIHSTGWIRVGDLLAGPSGSLLIAGESTGHLHCEGVDQIPHSGVDERSRFLAELDSSGRWKGVRLLGHGRCFGIATDPEDDRLYVLDHPREIVCFDAQGSMLWTNGPDGDIKIKGITAISGRGCAVLVEVKEEAIFGWTHLTPSFPSTAIAFLSRDGEWGDVHMVGGIYGSTTPYALTTTSDGRVLWAGYSTSKDIVMGDQTFPNKGNILGLAQLYSVR